jgi:hypothetical protein
VLPFGALITAGLAFVVMARRPEVRWVGCAALPSSCLAGIQPAAVAVAGQPVPESARA